MSRGFKQAFKIEKVKKAVNEGGVTLLTLRTLRFLGGKVARLKPIDFLLRKKSISKLRRFTEQERIVQPDKAVLEAYEYTGFGQYKEISPGQNPSELIGLAERAEEIKPETVVEIGTARGGTLYVWTQVFDTAQKFISVDLPGGRFGGGYSKGRASFYKTFSDKEINCIRRDSHKNKTKKILKEKLEGKKIDFLFIDGDHTYEGVKQDFEMYRDLVSDNGLIAFHDILPHPDSPDCNVDKFWNEIKSEYETEEIVADENQGWAGIGIIRLNK